MEDMVLQDMVLQDIDLFPHQGKLHRQDMPHQLL
jgi:hypothetical protein